MYSKRFAMLLPVMLAFASAGQSRAATSEVMTGGLVFAPSDTIAIERVAISLSLEKIEASYVVRNGEASEQAILVTMPLPTLDMLALGDAEITLADRGNSNFIEAAISVDGQPVTPRLEQRLVALGLDVTQDVFRAGLPLFPLAADMAARIAELTEPARLDLIERAILRRDDDKLYPAWTLRSTLYWRQPLPAGEAVTFTLRYRPIVGSRGFSAEAVEAVRRSHCVTSGLQQTLDRRTMVAKKPETISTIGYALSTNWASYGPITDFRLSIEHPDHKSLLSSCREGWVRVGPTTQEIRARDFYPDDDIHVLIVR